MPAGVVGTRQCHAWLFVFEKELVPVKRRVHYLVLSDMSRIYETFRVSKQYSALAAKVGFYLSDFIFQAVVASDASGL